MKNEIGSYGDYLNGYTDVSSQDSRTKAFAKGKQDGLDGKPKKTLEQFDTWVVSQSEKPTFPVGSLVVYDHKGTRIPEGQVGVVKGHEGVLNLVVFDAETQFIHRLMNQELKLFDAIPTTSSGAQREKLNVLPYDLVPFQEMTDAYVRVAEHGAEKYAPWNWTKGLSRAQLIGSLLRHTFAYLRGEERDKDSGLSHTDHILWNASALSHNVHHGLEDGRRVEPDREYKNKPGV